MEEKKVREVNVLFRTRLISGIVLVLIALITVISGGPLLFTTVSIISIIGMSELYKVFQIHNKPLGMVGYLGAVCYFGLLYLNLQQHIIPLLILIFLIGMVVYVFSFPKMESSQVMSAFFGLFYVAVLLSYIYLTREGIDGQYLVWLIFLSAWGCDTCAYCVGVLIGKHKMAPKLSPKKSVEGGIGGVVGAVLLGFLYGTLFSSNLTAFSNPALSCAIICGVGSMISQVGDLAASAIKRNHGIKDYGKLIPGHGGILDRFDSVIFTAPIIYYVAQLLR